MTVTCRRASPALRDQGPTRPLSLLLLPTRPSAPRSCTDLGWITYPPGTKRTSQRIWAKLQANVCCPGLLHPNLPAWEMAADVSGPPGFSPLISLPMLEQIHSTRQGNPPPAPLHKPGKGKSVTLLASGWCPGLGLPSLSLGPPGQ